MMTWTVFGSVLAFLGVGVLLVGSLLGNRTNDQAHEGLARQIGEVQGNVTDVRTDVETLRTETHDGFAMLSEQIASIAADRNTDN